MSRRQIDVSDPATWAFAGWSLHEGTNVGITLRSPDLEPGESLMVWNLDVYQYDPHLDPVTVKQGATQQNVTGEDNWATVKKTGEYVIVEASLDTPLTAEQAAQVIDWDGGEAVEGNPLQRKVSKAQAQKTTVKATVKNQSDKVDVWVIWASITIKTSGTTPAGAVQFGTEYDGTETLGAMVVQVLEASPKWFLSRRSSPPARVRFCAEAGDFIAIRSNIRSIMAWRQTAIGTTRRSAMIRSLSFNIWCRTQMTRFTIAIARHCLVEGESKRLRRMKTFASGLRGTAKTAVTLKNGTSKRGGTWQQRRTRSRRWKSA